jgi:tRNA threonylcarbamoyladenosine modification (KEOPS) complex  Pcc1 subunit
MTSRLNLIQSSVTIKFDLNPRVCSAVVAALEPEVQRGSEQFVDADVTMIDKHLILLLKAKDLTNLRAGVNSYFSLIRASSETLKSLP